MANYGYSSENVMLLADDSGLSRTTAMTYRANNEIDTAADYNGAANYTFDAWGRTNTEAKNGVTKTYSWTSANLLQGINSSDPNETDVSYNYTGDLKRVWRLENEVLTNAYQWDAGFNVTNEFSNVNPMKTFAPGLAEVSGNSPGTSATYNYLTTDHLGSTRGMWNGSIAQTGSWEFTPYGSPYNLAGPGDVTQLYTGHDLDKVTGQYYAPFRYLEPDIGRWASSDPTGMLDGTNLYSYVGGDPTNSSDPFGLWRRQAISCYLRGLSFKGPESIGPVSEAAYYKFGRKIWKKSVARLIPYAGWGLTFVANAVSAYNCRREALANYIPNRSPTMYVVTPNSPRLQDRFTPIPEDFVGPEPIACPSREKSLREILS